MVLTPKQFKEKWESSKKTGVKGVNFNEVYQCAIDWGLCMHPDKFNPRDILIRVLGYSGVEDWGDL